MKLTITIDGLHIEGDANGYRLVSQPNIDIQLEDDPRPDDDGCKRSGQGDGKHKWVQFPKHWICNWCGEHRAIAD